MDGVLFDTIPFAEEFYLKEHPGMTTKMYIEIHTGNFHEESKKHSHLQIPRTEEERAQRRINYADKKSKTPLFEGMKGLLETLHNDNYILVMNTNAYDRNCLPLLENAGIKNLFDFIASAEISKDKIEKFKLIEEKYQAEKKDILFITDALGDVRDADVAQISTVAVTWGVHNKAFFEREEHTNLIGIVNTTEELIDFIKSTTP